MARPLALTLGEPAGIGPDITFAAWRRRAELDLAPFYLLADPDFVARCAQRIAPDVPIAVVEPDAGFLRPELAIRTMAAAAVAAGATLITATPVRGVESVPGGARVLLDNGVLTARHVVVCAGAWVGRAACTLATK